MRQNSIKSKLFLLKISIIALVCSVLATFYLNTIADSSRETILQGLSIEKDFADLILQEKDSLKEIKSLDKILNMQDSLLKKTLFLDSSELNSLLSERKNLFSDSFQTVKESSQLLLNVHETIVFLISSTRYIHEHHIAYLKNFVQRGNISQDYDINERLQNFSADAAPEIEIIRVAAIIQSSLVDILDAFNDVFLESHGTSKKDHFPEIIERYYTAVITFEDYSLDAQDGLLVEELLTKGRILEKQFNLMHELENKKQVNVNKLAENRASLHSALSHKKEELEHNYKRSLTTINTLQAIIILSVLFLVSLIFFYGKRIIAEITKTIHETEKINTDLSYQIAPSTSTFDEFNMVFQTLNTMASQINTSISGLQQARDEMENRVKERTFELQEANKLLLQEIDERKKAKEEKERLQTQLRHTQKLEAIGTLAGGIAHDFNNILTGILGSSELAKLKIKNKKPVDHEIDIISESGNRAKELVKQILTFSRQSKQDICTIKIQPIIEESIKLLRASLPTTISIVDNIDQEVRAMEGSSTQIHQIIMNICNNAFHAMEHTGGIIKIALSSFLLTSNKQAMFPNLIPGEYGKLSISDTGQGIEPSIVERIFEPFFTTKAAGKGTGMGLSVVHGIVENHGGTITVNNSPGKGTTFNIYLPLVPDTTDSQFLTTKGEAGIILGNERVLLLDDEDTIIDMHKKSLEFLGYEVDATTDSKVALEHFQKKPQNYDVLITDHTMPVMTGIEFAEEIRKIDAHIPIILCSGYSVPISEKKMEEVKIKEFLTKPTTGIKLSETIRKVIDSPQ